MMGNRALPSIAYWLGAAGLLPQVAVVAVLLSDDLAGRFTALAIGYAYAALIFSFLGGLWWGLAAAQPNRAPTWVWIASVVPSLIALATAWPWTVGLPWPGPSLVVLGIGLIAALGMDTALVRLNLAPPGWMKLRIPLSLGLGALTLVSAFL